MKTHTFEVTQADINRANIIARDKHGYIYPNRCPVSLAICRSTKKGMKSGFVSVKPGGTDAIKIGCKIIIAPRDVTVFTEYWDHGLPVTPFTFTLEY